MLDRGQGFQSLLYVMSKIIETGVHTDIKMQIYLVLLGTWVYLTIAM